MVESNEGGDHLLALDSGGPFARYARNLYSQSGEDGILERLFAGLDICAGFCVEFGAWDGTHFSNTYNLISNSGWQALLIEADEDRFEALKRNVASFEGITCMRAMVGFNAHDGLDRILGDARVPVDFDLLSVDIDGNDYHVWDAMKGFRPKVVVIEFNPTIPNHVEFVQSRNMKVKQGNSLLSLTKLAATKNYVPLAVTANNVVFVDEAVARQAHLASPPLDVLRPWHTGETNLLHLYDGTVVLSGATGVATLGIEHRMRGLQIVPGFLRVYPPDAKPWQRNLLRLLRVIRRLQRGSSNLR